MGFKLNAMQCYPSCVTIITARSSKTEDMYGIQNKTAIKCSTILPSPFNQHHCLIFPIIIIMKITKAPNHPCEALTAHTNISDNHTKEQSRPTQQSKTITHHNVLALSETINSQKPKTDDKINTQLSAVQHAETHMHYRMGLHLNSRGCSVVWLLQNIPMKGDSLTVRILKSFLPTPKLLFHEQNHPNPEHSIIFRNTSANVSPHK